MECLALFNFTKNKIGLKPNVSFNFCTILNIHVMVAFVQNCGN